MFFNKQEKNAHREVSALLVCTFIIINPNGLITGRTSLYFKKRFIDCNIIDVDCSIIRNVYGGHIIICKELENLISANYIFSRKH